MMTTSQACKRMMSECPKRDSRRGRVDRRIVRRCSYKSLDGEWGISASFEARRHRRVERGAPDGVLVFPVMSTMDRWGLRVPDMPGRYVDRDCRRNPLPRFSEERCPACFSLTQPADAPSAGACSPCPRSTHLSIHSHSLDQTPAAYSPPSP